MQKVRVRYAPSPTGLLHIGNARSALFNYLFAKHFQGDFIVRIEDTDIKRNVKDGEKSQLELLEWLGIQIDESPIHGGAYGPYRQLERLELYQSYANQLVESGHAYQEENGAIRFKVPHNTRYTFEDLVRGTLSFKSEDVEDWIIMKENGIPTYNFAVVIDDHHMAITHVFRGEEHITNTPKQLMVYEALNFEAPQFGHMTIIVNEQKKKLSKRDHDVVQFISEYKEMGYLPEAMFNFIALLGWSPPIDQEILDQKAFIQYFDGTRFVKAPSMFDREKLKFVNSKYIKACDLETLSLMLEPYLISNHIVIESQAWLKQLTTVFQERLHYLGEIVELYQNFLNQPFVLDEEMISFLMTHHLNPLVQMFKENITNIVWESEPIQHVMKTISETLGIKGKPLFMGLRIATTAELHGPSLPNILALLPKSTVLKRLEDTLKIWRG
jgi:glutamyl-tRNA synthetase/nondiscriminating glutamyl-tRNA synthetase